MTDAEQVTRLMRQLRKPAAGPRRHESEQIVMVAGYTASGEYALAVAVELRDEKLSLARPIPPSLVAMVEIGAEGYESAVTLEEKAENATHHLVLLWKQERVDDTFYRRIWRKELKTHTFHLPPALDPSLLEKAIQALWASEEASEQRTIRDSFFPPLETTQPGEGEN